MLTIDLAAVGVSMTARPALSVRSQLVWVRATCSFGRAWRERFGSSLRARRGEARDDAGARRGVAGCGCGDLVVGLRGPRCASLGRGSCLGPRCSVDQAPATHSRAAVGGLLWRQAGWIRGIRLGLRAGSQGCAGRGWRNSSSFRVCRWRPSKWLTLSVNSLTAHPPLCSVAAGCEISK